MEEQKMDYEEDCIYYNTGDTSDSGKANAFKPNYVVQKLSSLMGKVLTIIDASITGDQNVAVKHLVKQVFSSEQEEIWNWSRLKEIEDFDMEKHGNYSSTYFDSMVPYDVEKIHHYRIR